MGGVKANYSAFPLSIFFLLTGYFLLEGTRKTNKWYFRKKVIRIVPLYWSLTILIFAVSFVMPGINHGRNYMLNDLVRSLLFIPYYNSDGKLFPILSVGWTLIIEVYDYIVFWIVYKLLKKCKYRDVLAIIFMSGLILLGVAINTYLHNCPILDIWTNKYQLPFILGLALNCLRQRKEEKDIKKGIFARPYILIVLVAIFYVFCYHIPDNYAWACGFVLVSVAIFLFDTSVFPRWSVYLGNISYSIYLIHKFVIAVMEKVVAHFSITPITVFVGVTFTFVITIGTATVSYNLIEKKFCRFLRSVICRDY